jgi:hypothetical protein
MLLFTVAISLLFNSIAFDKFEIYAEIGKLLPTSDKYKWPLFASILPTANKQWYTLLSIKNSM